MIEYTIISLIKIFPDTECSFSTAAPLLTGMITHVEESIICHSGRVTNKPLIHTVDVYYYYVSTR